MDTYLLAPMNPLAYFINRSVDVEDMGRVAFSLAATIYALTLMQANWTIIVLLSVFLVVPIALYATIGIFASALSIRYIDTFRIYDVVHNVSQLAKYPTSIFPNLLRVLLFTALPVAAAGYVPLSVLIHQQSTLLLLSSVAVLTLLLVSVWYWKQSLRFYASAGG